MRLLIDADIVAFRAASVTERVYDWGDDIWSMASDLGEAKRILSEQIGDITLAAGKGHRAAKPVLVFSDDTNWRKLENPTYKSNRKGVRKPIVYRPLVEWCIKNLPVLQCPNLEADDVLGIEATRDPEGTVVCSIDKDLAGIPCSLYNWDKMVRPEEVDLASANLTFFTQCLTGDSTDGYPGLKGCGPAGAKKILDGLDPLDESAMWSAIIAAYFSKMGESEETLDFATTQARMARICRDGDWDFDTRTMVWKAPTV